MSAPARKKARRNNKQRKEVARPCRFSRDGIFEIDYRDIDTLRRYVTAQGKIQPRKKNNTTAYYQRQLNIAVKRAFLSSVANGWRLRRQPMANTVEVILTDNILKLGNMGDLVKVKAGYARNYLLPYGKAIPADKAAKRQVAALQARAAEFEAEQAAVATKLKAELDGFKAQISAKVAHDTVLFGSVGARDIVKALTAGGFNITNNQVHIHENFKELGRFDVEIGLHKGVNATIKLKS